VYVPTVEDEAIRDLAKTQVHLTTEVISTLALSRRALVPKIFHKMTLARSAPTRG
jgi:hypothetical protein